MKKYNCYNNRMHSMYIQVSHHIDKQLKKVCNLLNEIH